MLQMHAVDSISFFVRNTGIKPILCTIRSSGSTEVFSWMWTMSKAMFGISERRMRRRELAKEIGRFRVNEK